MSTCLDGVTDSYEWLLHKIYISLNTQRRTVIYYVVLDPLLEV